MFLCHKILILRNSLPIESHAVRHVVQHKEVVAPSEVEDFVTDCAIRDVLQKGINSQLHAFDCLVETQASCSIGNSNRWFT